MSPLSRGFFSPLAKWIHCIWPQVKQNIMAVACSRGCYLMLHSQEAEKRRQVQDIPFQGVYLKWLFLQLASIFCFALSPSNAIIIWIYQRINPLVRSEPSLSKTYHLAAKSTVLKLVQQCSDSEHCKPVQGTVLGICQKKKNITYKKI